MKHRRIIVPYMFIVGCLLCNDFDYPRSHSHIFTTHRPPVTLDQPRALFLSLRKDGGSRLGSEDMYAIENWTIISKRGRRGPETCFHWRSESIISSAETNVKERLKQLRKVAHFSSLLRNIFSPILIFWIETCCRYRHIGGFLTMSNTTLTDSAPG